jgi:mycothiol synthase
VTRVERLPAAARPTELHFRPYAGESDLADLVRIENAEYEADSVPGRVELEGYRAHLRHPSAKFDPARDITLALVGGEAVAFASREWRDNNDGVYREYKVEGHVHPAWRRRGIGSALLEHSEQVTRELAATHESTRPRVFGSGTGETQAGDVALLKSHGYSEVRWFFDMNRPNLHDIPDVPLPAGLEMREVTPDTVYPVWRAVIEAFRDNWGGRDESDEALTRYTESPNHDVSLWLVAYDGDEVAGGVLNGIEREENEALGVQRGWLHSVFTRRQWRKRGLAAALISRSLVALRDRGMTSAILEVDADNPTGALGLYERAGFEVSYRQTAWRKPMENA